MAIQEQVLKANPSVLHNQSLSMARQRALTMQALAVLAAQNISTRALTWLFPRGAAILCAAARQRVLPKAPRSQVLHSGERRPLAAAARGTGARQQPRGQRRGRGSLPGCSHLRHPQHLALAHGESAKLNKL